MLNPIGLISGHYECRSFDESLPILEEFLALKVVGERNEEKIVRHPNTGWELVVHAHGADAPIKSMRNHYGVRVATNTEVDRATEYLETKKERYGIKIIKPRENHNAYSVHFYEPGGNYWEIESYERAVEHGMGKTTNPHWSTPLPAQDFSGRGYVPQALTHGTLENDDLEASECFYREALGLEVVKLWPSSCYVKHRDTPWYVVCIQAQNPNRRMLSRYQRFTIALASRADVHSAHRDFTTHQEDWRLRALEEITESDESASFQLADLNGNWWEILHRNPSGR
ncbi:MAG TPA: VOC family protein [Candidatus Binatia bacterium]|nr:VOC family protein [Candidatus Binatia bacterium]